MSGRDGDIPGGWHRLPGDERDRWTRGRIRHLRLTDWCPPDTAFAIRALHRRHGSEDLEDLEDILYTLVVHPRHANRVEDLRRELEPRVGGPFSPDADADVEAA